MADELLHQPHDKLFRSVFSDPAEAAALLRAVLPAPLPDRIHWNTLSLLPDSFIDDTLRATESDLLFEVRHEGFREPIHVYVLLEHQSSPDRWMPFRLLKYCFRIWEPHANGSNLLRPILPVVFYLGPRRWNYPTEFVHLFPEECRELAWTPRFDYLLLDRTGVEPDQVGGDIGGRIAQLLMMAAFTRNMRDIKEALNLAASLVAAGTSHWPQLRTYLLATQHQEQVQAFADALQRHDSLQGGEIMSYAQQLLEEGLAKGRNEGLAEGERRAKVEMIEGFLRTGMTWDVIQQATGLDESQFLSLKQQAPPYDK